MKKLLIILAVALTAIATQAASYSWDWAGNQVKNPTSSYDWMSITATDNAIATLYCTDASIGSGALATSTFDGGAFGGRYVLDLGEGNTLVSPSNGAYDFYLVITYTAADNKVYTYTTDTVTSETFDGMNGSSLTFGSLADETKASANKWTVVPEPTSGLLLLMGMGALALRRKQK